MKVKKERKRAKREKVNSNDSRYKARQAQLCTFSSFVDESDRRSGRGRTAVVIIIRSIPQEGNIKGQGAEVPLELEESNERRQGNTVFLPTPCRQYVKMERKVSPIGEYKRVDRPHRQSGWRPQVYDVKPKDREALGSRNVSTHIVTGRRGNVWSAWYSHTVPAQPQTRRGRQRQQLPSTRGKTVRGGVRKGIEEIPKHQIITGRRPNCLERGRGELGGASAILVWKHRQTVEGRMHGMAFRVV
ncbi:uncharacterized protein BDCG_16162 [Blastomyces dermatitidis ER-3]|uniref:Uncharacterized protein n=1 Tax=Ajellomyces dermatitidis (strain ER-3 / ATCC MYA-2586) TaxID=559297 RepID=A0ABX2VQF4_AJEDR|nr:uncharacterized protein BDCG_16162 [Blastomyces dermatitidis ER-3]EQL29338.1 hypothetical protein BDFG_08062 [Blastomyces dermatitidis ATCC 26199]OAS99479.1 hypothetical protein BDCG_16162 [Blastomyces dermatitidis ER-3]